ncbi:integrase catalytic subunit [Burkholderia pseudomallei]|uniref:transposase n=1 Tax=Burkholderia pseudomallei TaxID=28450 RepID=UPI00293B0E53|nr:integrase catalytic subunit [Burkholderia pseudomallei]CAJ2884108.1 integrase catalytic subunit [Burkholderia pseudomallei]CAJ4233752.1 integrase catalytic subunit [Burkholderia pseudomallei]CAJ9460869.1 integrase catalytic subunit [Burkholderia pseudomallei]CAK0061635.1 integrase catalytic subunit [Burkholderia pseudomallei]
MMSDLRTGDKLALPGKPDSYLEVLDGRLHAGAIELFDVEKRAPRYVEYNDICARISEGSLVLHRKGMPRVSIVAQYDNPALHERVRLLTYVLRRIDEICEQRGVSFDAAIPLARDAYAKEHAGQLLVHPFPSRATLYRARKNQLLGLPVLRGDKNKGNATPRYSIDLVEFVKDVIQDNFLVTESKWTVNDVTRYINREARRRGLHVAENAISRKFVCATIGELTVDAEYDRMDPLNRVAGKSYAKKRIRAAFPFARIEQDALHLPFVVRTPHGIARTVYLVLAIDVCTGYPVGWHLVIGSPREMDSLLCLEMYLTPAKAARFAELGIAHALNIYGTPVQVIFDNGPETKGERIVRLERLGMDVKHCKAKEAQGKPFIERLNRSLKEALQRLSGCTRFEGEDGKRDPEARGDELMTDDELEKWIVGWLYKDWVNTPLDRLRWDELLVDSVKGKTPLERLAYQTEEMGQPITLPPPRREWMAALFEHKVCALSAKTGITVERGFRYNGEAKPYLLAKYGDRAELRVVYNPDDFRQVYVYEGDDLPLVTLTHDHVRPDTPAWTFAEAKARFDAGMDDWVVPDEKVQFERDLDEAVTGKGKARRPKARGKREENKETVRRAKDDSALQRALDRPLSAAAPFGPPPSTNPSLPAEDLMADAISYDDAPLMNIVNRKTGEKLL